MTLQDVPAAPRMKAAERRELILEAATAVFGARTYVGTTTDEIARAAGVSQPYVVRLFGTKEKLFIEVVERAYARVIAEFRAALPGDLEGRMATHGHRVHRPPRRARHAAGHRELHGARR